MATLSRRLIQPLLTAALREDIGRGDLTSRAVIPPRTRIRAAIVAKTSGVVAGTTVAQWVFQTVDRRIRVTIARRDGHRVRPGQVIMRLAGPAHGILAAERTALNFLGHLSGIAMLTAAFVRRVPARVAILDTRKTLPGLRRLEKYAVRVGGGKNHRWGMDDAVLIKTNHLKILTRDSRLETRDIPQIIREAKRRAKERFVELEVTNLHEFVASLQAKPDAILLDNWSLPNIRKAVALRRSSVLLEVSGGATLTNVRAIAATGIDRISIGRLTHSAPALDVSLRVNGSL